MGIRDIELTTIDGQQTTLADYADKTVLVVNVASRCGLTPQYEKLEQLQKQYEDQGFTVLGFPCNQFMGQEPGSNEEIQEFCSMTYGVTFPLMDKVKVNGRNRHPLYAELTQVDDDDGKAGKVQVELREVRHRARRHGVALLGRRHSPTTRRSSPRSRTRSHRRTSGANRVRAQP